MIYRVSMNRLLYELRTHAKGKSKGVLNWFIDAETGLFNIYYDVYNVTYLCKLLRSDISEELRTYLGESRVILMVEGEERIDDSFSFDNGVVME